MNQLILGDNLEILKSLPSESIDLIYLDPPFFSNKNYEIIWGDKGEIRSFKDRWAGGIDHYISWLKERVVEMHRLLKPTGSIYLHCDHHANAHIKVYILDKLFGNNNFRNEIVWHYFMGGKSKKFFSRKHDIIYFYTKSEKYNFQISTHNRILINPSLKSHKNMQPLKCNKCKQETNIYLSEVLSDDVWDISGVFNMSRTHRLSDTKTRETDRTNH